jgi:hypothetical protein
MKACRTSLLKEREIREMTSHFYKQVLKTILKYVSAISQQSYNYQANFSLTSSQLTIVQLGAIQKIRDTFLALFQPSPFIYH